MNDKPKPEEPQDENPSLDMPLSWIFQGGPVRDALEIEDENENKKATSEEI